MFIDEVEIEVAAGSGGNGMVTFRKEKFVPLGGPNGGDGGRGGSVIFQVDHNLSTLLDFRYRKTYKAERGGDGGSKDMFGKNGADLVLKVPPGTIVTNLANGEVLADLNEHDSIVVIARGGEGGRGNAHFANSVHQAPRFAEKGEPGEHLQIKLELRLLADVGLLGYPNAGKSTLISAVSAAKPRIANYPFTTLTPHLGVVYLEQERSFVMADIPGIIEGASMGVGLGHQFLRHIARSRLLVHLLDAGGMSGRDPLQDYEILCRELQLYDAGLAALPQIIALNKCDLVSDSDTLDALQQELQSRGLTVFRISAATRQGLQPLLYHIMQMLETLRQQQTDAAPDTMHYVAIAEEDNRKWKAAQEEDGLFVVTGKGLERMVAMTDMENQEALRRLQRALDRMGIHSKLRALGIQDGDTVRIGTMEFEFADEARMAEEIDMRMAARKRRKHNQE